MALEDEACSGLQQEAGMSSAVSVSAAGDGRWPAWNISHLEFGEVAGLLTTEGLHRTCCFIYRAKLGSDGFPHLAFQLVKYHPLVMFNAMSVLEGRKDN